MVLPFCRTCVRFRSLGIALIPSATDSEPATASYPVDLSKCESIVGRVAVDDSSAPDARPVILQVIGDTADRVLYTSPALSRPGESFFFRVPLLGCTEITLRAALADPTVDAYVPL